MYYKWLTINVVNITKIIIKRYISKKKKIDCVARFISYYKFFFAIIIFFKRNRINLNTLLTVLELQKEYIKGMSPLNEFLGHATAFTCERERVRKIFIHTIYILHLKLLLCIFWRVIELMSLTSSHELMHL